VGYVRTPLDRQKLVDYMTTLVQQSIRYGQVATIEEDKEQRKQIVVDALRGIAFASPK
jgi:NAD(P)H-hydrate repair Nnr-like enzyme with NAD(P)H-hydrate epimerase domain